MLVSGGGGSGTARCSKLEGPGVPLCSLSLSRAVALAAGQGELRTGNSDVYVLGLLS